MDWICACLWYINLFVCAMCDRLIILPITAVNVSWLLLLHDTFYDGHGNSDPLLHLNIPFEIWLQYSVFEIFIIYRFICFEDKVQIFVRDILRIKDLKKKSFSLISIVNGRSNGSLNILQIWYTMYKNIIFYSIRWHFVWLMIVIISTDIVLQETNLNRIVFLLIISLLQMQLVLKGSSS